jgi:hypothetical protein
MKRIYIAFVFSLVSGLFTDCVREQIEEPYASVELTAMIEAGQDTKTTLSGLDDGMYYPLWSAGDEIAVYVDGDSAPSRFSLKSGDGMTMGTFTGTRKGNDYLAVYPYDIAGSFSDGIMSVTLPQTQKYVKDSFGPGAFPMMAVGEASAVMDFRNLCSVLKISFTGKAAVASVTLTANDENTFLSGPASVSSESEDALSMSSGGSRSVVLDTRGLEISENSPADVFIVIPSQIYKGGLTIEVDTYTEKITKTVSTDLTFERSQIRAIKDFVLDSEVPDIIPEAIPDNEIWYVSTNGRKISLNDHVNFGAKVIEHTYENGKGIIRFDGPVINLASMGANPNLSKVILPKKIERIIGNPFYSCLTLSEIISDMSTEDGRCLIMNGKIHSFASYGIEEYVTPAEAVSTAEHVFSKTHSLKKIVFSEGFETLGSETFADNTKIEEVYLPSTLKKVEPYAFGWCTSIKKFHGNTDFVSDDGYAVLVRNYNGIAGSNFMVAFASGNDLTSYDIPDGVTAIDNYTFCEVESLTSIRFSEPMTYIGPSAFYKTNNIEYIEGPGVLDDNRSLVANGVLSYVADKGISKYEVPEGVTKIGWSVFGNKLYLEEVKMSDTVTEVEGYGYICSGSLKLKTLTVSARMQDLRYDPFGTRRGQVPELETVYMRAPIPPAVITNFPDEIRGQYDNFTIYVPQESYELYMSSESWSPYVEYIKPYDYGDLSEFYPDYYISSDYSQDGVVKTLQTATVGNGIDIVLMGDAYSDREIADGSYEADMRYMYENLFTEEPFKTHKDMFNVYYVTVVSTVEGYDNPGAKLEGYFGEGTLVGGNDQKSFEYALKAVSEERMDETLVIVAMNSDVYAGTCYMYYPESATGTYSSGPAVAYFPKGTDQTTFAQLLHHEANGHGFAKLADEYAYEDFGAVPDANVTQTCEQQNQWGWWKNVDFTNDPAKVRWSYFLEDARYANEGLGVFEGGLTYWTGVWRPTENSIMRYNTGGFNAPSREAIYYRIHKLAYGDSWEYSYEDFVEYDAVNRSTSSSAPQKARRNYVEKPLEPTAAPVVVGKSWRDAR